MALGAAERLPRRFPFRLVSVFVDFTKEPQRLLVGRRPDGIEISHFADLKLPILASRSPQSLQKAGLNTMRAAKLRQSLQFMIGHNFDHLDHLCPIPLARFPLAPCKWQGAAFRPDAPFSRPSA